MRPVLNTFISIVVGLILLASLLEGSRSSSAIGASPPSCEPSKDQRGVKTVLDAFVKAWNQDDASALASLFVEKGEFTSPSGRTVRGRAEIRRLVAEERKDMFRDTTLTLSLQDEQPSENGAVLVEGTYTVQAPASPLGMVEFSSKGSFQFTMQPDNCAHYILQAHTNRS